MTAATNAMRPQNMYILLLAGILLTMDAVAPIDVVGGSANAFGPPPQQQQQSNKKPHQTDDIHLKASGGSSQFTVDHLMLMAPTAAAATNNNNNNGGGGGLHDIIHLVFQPSLLDFNELAVGDANSDVVTVFNRHSNRSVFLGSISGNVPDFYSSFFEEKVIPPMGNTTFNVVFLPRQQGAIETELQIHTSFGLINYTLKGRGVECLFRLNPLVGLRAPLNATLTPEIWLYNPYPKPLQILEVYSSGGQFQLELPSGGPEGPQTLWLIPPFTTKPVIRVRFKATSPPGNYTAYIRIKVTSEHQVDLDDIVLVVPIEVETTAEHGIYSELPFVNFGMAGTADRSKRISFRLLNSGLDPIDVTDVAIEASADVIDAISLHVDRRESGAATQTDHLMMATIDWSKLLKTERYFKGFIRISSQHQFNNKRVMVHRIPFVGEVIPGSIHYNESHTRFVSKKPGPSSSSTTTPPTQPPTANSKEFRMKNNFSVPLAVNAIEMSEDAAKYFKTSEFSARVLQPGEEAALFRITQLAAAAKRPIVRSFQLHTNVSVYEIPLLTYNGLLRRIVPVDETTVNGRGIDERIINYGTLPLSTVTDTVLALINDSPVPVTIHNWTTTVSDMASIYVILRGCGNLTTDNLKFCYSIQPNEWMLFQVSVLSNAIGSFVGRLVVQTEYEELVTPVRFTTAMGRLQFSATMLNDNTCYPGGLCSVNLTAYSTFQQPMAVKEILVNVTGITYDYSNTDFPPIAPNEQTHIGQLQFSPKAICSNDDCYIAFPDPLAPSVISSNCKHKVADLMSAKLEAFRIMRSSFAAITFRVQTNHVRRYDFNGSATLHWPRFVQTDHRPSDTDGDGADDDDDVGVSRRMQQQQQQHPNTPPLTFETRLAGEEVIKHIVVHNPTEHPLRVYYAMHDIGQMGTTMTLPPELISACWYCFLSREPSAFTFVDTVGGDTKRSALSVIPAGHSQTIAVRFMTHNPGTYSNLLYVRNNFTILEATWLTATAKPHQFKFGNRRPGSDMALSFDLGDKNIRACEESHIDGTPIMLTAKRTFTAKNTGDVPIDVYGMYVEGLRCEGYGFRVVDCWNFRLPPNTSKKIEILFTPDLTLAKVERVLSIDTSLNYPINYTMQSMIPANVLTNCSKAIRRPAWEFNFHVVVFVTLIVAIFFVAFVSFLDAEKVLHDHLQQMSRDKGPAEPTLDLREVGMRGGGGYGATAAAADTSGGSSSSVTKPFAYLRKRQTAALVKQQQQRSCDSSNATDMFAEAAGAKKSWATVLARKFSPIKTDVKFRETTPPRPSVERRSYAAASMHSKKALTRDIITALMDAVVVTATAATTITTTTTTTTATAPTTDGTKDDEDASSTTTETSMQSNDSEKKQTVTTPPSARRSAPADAAVAPSAKTKPKMSVKKTKSLPAAPPPTTATTTTKEDVNRAISPPAQQTAAKCVKMSNGGGAKVLQNGRAVTSPAAAAAAELQPKKELLDGTQKKYGKTPGRERKKAEAVAYPIGSAARKLLPKNVAAAPVAPATTTNPYKGTAFQFTSPLTNSPTPASSATTAAASSPIWEINKVSFSNIVAQNSYSMDLPLPTPPPPPPFAAPIAQMEPPPTTTNNLIQKPQQQPSTIASFGKLSAKSLFQSFNQHHLVDDDSDDDDDMISRNPLLEPSSSMHEDAFKPLGNLYSENLDDLLLANNSHVGDDGGTNIDLGPIGTRKSPSNTPLWEPMPLLQKPIAMNCGGESYFSDDYYNNSNGGFGGGSSSNGNMPAAASTTAVASSSTSTTTTPAATAAAAAASNIDLAGVAGLFDSVYGQNLTQQQRVWDPSTLLSLLQQHHQQHQQQQQQSQQRNGNGAGDGKMFDSDLLHQPQLLNDHNNIQQQNLYSNPSSLWGGSNYTQPGWMQGPIRPPPGLEQRHQQQNPHRRQQQQLNNNQSSSSFYNQPQLQSSRFNQLQQNDSMNGFNGGGSNSSTDTDNLTPQFDLFQSMSSIWSTDAWSNVGHQQQQQQNDKK